MMKNVLFLVGLMVLIFSCKKEKLEDIVNNNVQPIHSNHRISTGFPEGFNMGTKTSYASNTVTLASGTWTLNDALLGNTTSDPKTGTQSVRLRNAGKLTMNFNVTSGITTVSISHAKYGTDAASYWTLYASQDNGISWTPIGAAVYTNTTSLQTTTFTLNLSGNVRLEIRKTNNSSRINIDDITINEPDGPTRDNNMALGNPSNATTNTATPDNYLLVKPQYVLSYNNSRGGPNWVSWHLSAAWKGTAVRQNIFLQDASLPFTFYRPNTNAYTNSGFDRGHQCPSDDRDGTQADNDATFYMSNMLPQAPNANRVTWVSLEDYCRSLLSSNYECYIVAGGYGQGGTGSSGTTTTIDAGRIAVPAYLWKVVIILPVGDADVSRINTATRVIAVAMPNTQTVNQQSWGYYRTTVDAIEAATGYDIMSNVSPAIQAVLESHIDTGPTL